MNENSTGAGIGLIITNELAKRLNPTEMLGLHIKSIINIGS